MNRILIIIALVLVILLGGIWAFATLHQSSTGSANQNPFGFTQSPGGNEPANGGSTSGAPTRTLTLTDGSQAVIPDVTQQPQPSWASDVNGYYVGGTSAPDFHILYYPGHSSFLVSLYAEPLSQSRLEAEQALRSQLKLSDQQLCKIPINVTTSASVNETYAGHNLGLSFCPNAVKLP